MSIFSRPKKEVLIASFDITSSSVGGILFAHHPDRLPEVLTTSRFPTEILPELNFQKIQRSIHKTFERTIAALRKKMPEGKKKPDSVIITFSSPYFVSQTKIIRFRKSKPFKITERFLNGVVNEEAASFEKQWQKGNSRQIKSSNAVEIIEQEIMQTSLNGYSVKNLSGKRVHNFELSYYVSLGIKAIQDVLRECVSHSFGEMPVRFQSFPFVAFNALKDVLNIGKGLLLIDVGGEITDLFLIKNGILEESISFPLGENFLVRRIANVFRFSPEESASLLSQYARGDLHAAASEKVRKIITDAAAKWCDFFKEALEGAKDFSSLPKNFLFIGGKGALILKEFAPCTAERPLTSRFLLPEAFKNHFVFRKGFSEDKDILLMLEALFADKLFLND